jgi:flagellar motor protein MotB
MMAAALPAFQLASTLGPSTDEREEFATKIRSKDAEIEELRETKSGALTPQERQALVQLLSDLSKKVEDLEKRTEKQAKQIEDLQKENKALGKEIYEVREMAILIIQDACKRITKIEERNKPQITDNNVTRINVLAQELLTRAKAGQKGITYAEAAQLLKLDKSRICQLRGLISSDSRFNISWHPNRKNTKIICPKIMR